MTGRGNAARSLDDVLVAITDLTGELAAIEDRRRSEVAVARALGASLADLSAPLGLETRGGVLRWLERNQRD